jgi:FkbM family methyltransferase
MFSYRTAEADEMRRRLIEAIAVLTRRFQPRGIGRVVRFLHDPDRRDWSIESVVTLRETGLKMYVDTSEYIEWQVYFFGAYEPVLSQILASSVQAGSTAVDVGANVGVLTLRLASKVGAGKVLAVEPNPVAYDRLLKNVDLNKLENVVAKRIALAESDGSATLHIGTGPLRNATASLVSLRGLDGSSTVEVTTLDRLLEESDLPPVSVIKIDVEGMEPAVLRGATGVLQRDHPDLMFECSEGAWRIAGYSLNDVLDHLKDLGYSEFFAVGDRESKPLMQPVPQFMSVFARSPLRRSVESPR